MLKLSDERNWLARLRTTKPFSSARAGPETVVFGR
jgi:hypothetical protein